LEKEGPNEMEVAKKTYEEGKKEETKAKILESSIFYFIIYLLNIILILLNVLSNLLNTLKYKPSLCTISRG
jgi:hypothetical protein